ncbi:FadR family transcriptional regulator [Kordiimonas sp. SCSIO 12603]|uniref:FadR/GntR family transcriptional regulator n=1 Tax=Kordiimonas sp. SCSIO 12603 TaxID=2829596 RepID=UPI0021070AB6|nr:FadR/GntR family transcriptional regulator [Kordiimonas sp. SCSIO 12603]UTW58946.1 FadR family transcriptional regulator [Kordiimonas sp. SCSIO 12603]
MSLRPGGISFTRQLVNELGVAIVAGEYSRGEAFPTEADLCVKYEASRTAVREAIKMLTAKGLLAARPRHGTWILGEEQWNLLDPDVLTWLLERQFSVTLIKQFTETRRAFEPEAARLAALKMDEEKIAQIAVALERMEASEKGLDDPLASDIAFHVAVLNASDNPFFKQLEEMVKCALTYSIRLTNRFKGVDRASSVDHRAVYEAIAAGQSQIAVEAMQKLIDEALELIEKT